MFGTGWSKLAVIDSSIVLLCLISLQSCPVATAQETPDSHPAAVSPTSLWRDPGDISSRDLEFGQGGKDHAPDPEATYKFVKEDLGGSSPKFYVKDQNGVEWLVKVGDEARPETAATRFVWAMGYFTDEDYFLPRLHVSGLPKLHRKSRYVLYDGTVIAARLKRKTEGQKKIGYWSWFDNPFMKTRELNGLRVMMAMLNNWDLKTENNKIYLEENKEVRYVVSDLGATFGRTGAYTSRSKGKLKGYSRDRFILEATPETVNFVMRTKPSRVVRLVKGKYYRQQLSTASIVHNVPRADVEWIGEELSHLTRNQIRAALTAAGFPPDEVEGYTQVFKDRIAELNALPSRHAIAQRPPQIAPAGLSRCSDSGCSLDWALNNSE